MARNIGDLRKFQIRSTTDESTENAFQKRMLAHRPAVLAGNNRQRRHSHTRTMLRRTDTDRRGGRFANTKDEMKATVQTRGGTQRMPSREFLLSIMVLLKTRQDRRASVPAGETDAGLN